MVRLTAVAVFFGATAALACQGCGCRGGPGYRGPVGKCVGWTISRLAPPIYYRGRGAEGGHPQTASIIPLTKSPPGWARVQAICDFVHHHIAFGYEHARPTMTSWEVFNEGKGV